MRPKTQEDLSGQQLISIGEMAKKSHVSASAIRGYEKMGLFQQYGIRVIRAGNYRYFDPADAWKITQIKAQRISDRNVMLASQGQP